MEKYELGEIYKKIKKEICELEYGELKGADRLKNGDLASDEDCLSDAEIINPDAIWPILKEADEAFPETKFWQTMTDYSVPNDVKEKVMDEYNKILEWRSRFFGDELRFIDLKEKAEKRNKKLEKVKE